MLQALARLLGFGPSLRRVRRTDFNISPADLAKGQHGPLKLWIEAQFEFPELEGKTIDGVIHNGGLQLCAPFTP